MDGTGARPRRIGGSNVFGSLSYATPVGTFTGFAYLVDQDEAAVQGYRLSSQSYGGRLAGSRALSKTVKLDYALSYARQSDYRRNPNSYNADYWLADVTLDVKALKLNAGFEVLGASDGTTLTSFQTPLATGFKFQGWADKFLSTPPNGVRDLYAGAGYGWTKIGRIDAISLQVAFHRFESDRLGQHYGRRDRPARQREGQAHDRLRTLRALRRAQLHDRHPQILATGGLDILARDSRFPLQCKIFT